METGSVNLTQVLPFTTDISNIDIPQSFTFPYYYEPHPITNIAINELQHRLINIEQTYSSLQNAITQRMYAVLVVRNSEGGLGYLCSVRGLTQDLTSEISDIFVKDISFDDTTELINTQANSIHSLQQTIFNLQNDPNLDRYLKKLETFKKESNLKISKLQTEITQRKTQRKSKRAQADEVQLRFFAQQSSQDKQALKALKKDWKKRIDLVEKEINELNAMILCKENELKKLMHEDYERKLNSCMLLNQYGHQRSLHDIFKGKFNHGHTNTSHAELKFTQENLPKLLQTAFAINVQPIALGEFWWGDSPYDEIRQHRNLYPVCQSKCYEILEHMLSGIKTDKSPLEINPAKDRALSIVYQDEDIVVVNKPAEFLSVSGKYIKDSVEQRIRERFPDATGPLIVHRLDMSTSGLLVLTLNAKANKNLQQQFINRTVKKRYTALIQGTLTQESGSVSLPLTGDLLDRPRQKVCEETGRVATTKFKVVKRLPNHTLVHLYPITGRTHQLRVHCAHKNGLNSPIVGDDLYGFKSTRLHLHAGYIEFVHPTRNTLVKFEVESEFKSLL